MTDISGLTDEQVNEAIAVKRGWKTERVLMGLSVEHTRWIGASGVLLQPPDYTHSWNLCGELLEEIGHNSSVVNLQLDHTGFTCYVRRYPTANAKLIMTHSNDTPQRAICEAWLAWTPLPPAPESEEE